MAKSTKKTEADIIDGIIDGIIALALKTNRELTPGREQSCPDDMGVFARIHDRLSKRLVELDMGGEDGYEYECAQVGLDSLALMVFPHATRVLMDKAKAAVESDNGIQLTKRQLELMEDKFLDMIFASSATAEVASRWDAIDKAVPGGLQTGFPALDALARWRKSGESGEQNRGEDKNDGI